MSPKRAQPQVDLENQGAFFGVEVVGSGATDPLLQTHEVRLTDVVPEGIYPEKPVEPEAILPDPVVVEAVHKAVVKDHRHKGQLGKHSPLQRDGAYADLQSGTSFVKPGDYLPGFKVVTKTNLAAAEQHAFQLERQRQAKH